MLPSIYQKFENLSSGHQTGKSHFNPKGGQCQRIFRLSDNLLISQASNFMLKKLQARLQQHVNQELPDVQARFRKGLITRDQITNICGKFWKRWEYQTTWPASWETCMQVTKQQLEPYMEQLTVQNWEKSMTRLYTVILFNLYAEYITKNAGLESRLAGEISVTSDMQMIPL